jgi:hypothetical protein
VPDWVTPDAGVDFVRFPFRAGLADFGLGERRGSVEQPSGPDEAVEGFSVSS